VPVPIVLTLERQPPSAEVLLDRQIQSSPQRVVIDLELTDFDVNLGSLITERLDSRCVMTKVRELMNSTLLNVNDPSLTPSYHHHQHHRLLPTRCVRLMMLNT